MPLKPRSSSPLYLIAWILLSAGMCLSACSDAEDEFIPGADSDDPQSETDGDGSEFPSGDGDIPDIDVPDGDSPDGDGQQPQTWQDDTIDQWTVSPFCGDISPLAFDDFEDGELLSDPAWVIDPKVEENPEGEISGVSAPVVVDGSGQRGRYLSGSAEDRESDLPTARLYTPIGSNAKSFHMLSRLPMTATENLMWLNDDEDPSGSWKPQIRISHQYSDESGGTISIIEQSGMAWCSAQNLDEGWHRIELYKYDINKWRFDVDRVTRCSFDYSIDSDHPISFLFMGRDGHIDDLAWGDCPLPTDGRGCDSKEDCLFGEMCGRDKVCSTSRNITCMSQLQCADGDICLGESDGIELLGDGVCTSLCKRHADCRPTEHCFPHSFEEGRCLQICGAGGICPEGQSCRESFGIEACVPDNCKENGQWRKHGNGLWLCDCNDGYSPDPFTGRCEDLGDCSTGSDCASGQVCADGACIRNRNIPCEDDEACPQNSACFAFILDEVFAGEGQCLNSCMDQEDCLAYESCRKLHDGRQACLTNCESDLDCEPGFHCITEAPNGICSPIDCQPNGVWAWDESTGSLICQCTGSTRPDPFTGRCL